MLIGANLTGAYLSNADLRCANLRGADLTAADLSGANLHAARLRYSNFRNARLGNADLSATRLSGTNLLNAYLGGASIEAATASGAVFAGIDLRGVKGLKEIWHVGPSEISFNTFYASQGDIPEVFLRGCGLSDWEIEGAKLYRTDLSRDQIVELTYKVIELRSDPMIQFNSCFISYSSGDEKFARRLYADLQGSGVRCWFAPVDMRIGDRIRNRIDDSIRLQDKLLLVLSEASVSSQWIEQEVETALEKEREQNCEVLFPIRLDDAVMKIRKGWPALVRKSRHIGDFSRREDPDRYKKAYQRLLNDLKVNA
jgi:uncharacterized protein YjbI with pentapeptide repeats